MSSDQSKLFLFVITYNSAKNEQILHILHINNNYFSEAEKISTVGVTHHHEDVKFINNHVEYKLPSPHVVQIELLNISQ